MDTQIPKWAADLANELASQREQLNRIEALLVGRRQAAEDPITPDEAMKLMNYKDRSSFLRAVRQQRMPYIKLNRRRIAFDPVALREWRDRKSRNA